MYYVGRKECHSSNTCACFWVKCFPFLHIALVHARLLSPQKAMAPHSSTLAWKIPWMEEPGRLQSIELLRVVYFSLSCIGGGNGNPLQCSCLENPREGGAWWAAVYGVAQSRTRLKWLSSSSRVLGKTSMDPWKHTPINDNSFLVNKEMSELDSAGCNVNDLRGSTPGKYWFNFSA